MAALSFKQNRANRRRARSFESLVQAGLAVIAVRGLYETTVEHITEAADVGKGTFYAHFPSKEDLVHHLVRLGFGELIAAGRAKVSSGSAATDRLAALIRAQLRVLDRRRDLVILLHQARSLLILRRGARQRLRREYRRYIQFLVSGGGVPARAREASARLDGGPRLGLCRRGICGRHPLLLDGGAGWSGRAGRAEWTHQRLCRRSGCALQSAPALREWELPPLRGLELPGRT